MCAINGIVGKRDEKLVRAMNAATAHRGPDGTAVWSDEHITLGHNRLAIIDLSLDAAQPMLSAHERFVITFNGEIYNYQELRKELKEYPFKTKSDTEVILAAFEKWGTNCFARLEGMFAIALWDREKKELTLARDQSGIKPVYYFLQNNNFLFSSELKGILADETISRKIDRDALESYLRLRYVPEPLALIQGVSKLPAASFMVIKNGKSSIKKYFEARLQPLIRESHSIVDARARDLIDAAVEAQLTSDRPVGLFLSGGLDSTILLDAVTRARSEIKTFSLRFQVEEDENPGKFNTDADLARISAKHYGADHHEITFNEEEFVRLLPRAIYFLDQPVANATAVAQMFLAEEARKYIVVALQGDGGDELFGGYPRYRLSLLMDYYQYLSKTVRRTLDEISPVFRKLNTIAGIERMKLFMFEKDSMLLSAIHPEFVTWAPAKRFEKEYLMKRGETDFTQLFMDADRRSWLVDEALARTDAMTMASGLEARVPLLSTAIVGFASQLPSFKRVSLFDNKRILRRAFRGRVPGHIISAKKRGFFSPMAKWLRRPAMLALARECLSEGFHAGTDVLINFPEAQKLLEAHVEKRGYALSTLWTLISLRLWAREFKAYL